MHALQQTKVACNECQPCMSAMHADACPATDPPVLARRRAHLGRRGDVRIAGACCVRVVAAKHSVAGHQDM